MLQRAGPLIGRFLLALFIVKLAVVFFQFMTLHSTTLDECLNRVVLFTIPTGATIIETLAAYPIAISILLLFYIRYVKD
jgi:hypothetical protein